MGNDGGSIPTRRELVKTSARAPSTTELKATTLEALTHAWTFCPLSHKPLCPPIVSDCAGTLYNKDAVLEYLLPQDPDIPATVLKEKEDVLQGRITSLRDIIEVKFSIAKENGEEKKLCPITSKELNGHTKAVYLVPCGHAYSEIAIKELQSEGDNACVECNEPYEVENVIPILSRAEDDVARLRERARRLREKGLTHSGKKVAGGKKKKRKFGGDADGDGVDGGKNGVVDGVPEAATKSRMPETTKSKQEPLTSKPHPKNSSTTTTTTTPTPSGIKNASTLSLTAKVLNEQEERNKRRKLGMNDNLKSLFSNTGYDAHKQKGGDFMTRGFSMPKKS